ncbi:unnamed protein product [Urochloa humidicola]
MVKVFHKTWLDLQDQFSVSAPASGAYPSYEACWSSSESASSRKLSTRGVREAMAAYSVSKTVAEADLDEEEQFPGFAQDCMVRMLAFADAITGVERAPDNLLRTLDAYASVTDSAPLLLQMFAGFRKDSISASIERTSRLLSDAVRAMMNDAKESIVAHVTASAGGQSECDVLETVRCAMDDITLLFHNYRSLNIFLQQNDDGGDGGCMFDFGGISTLSYLIMELISCLEDSIEEKSRSYSDRSSRQKKTLVARGKEICCSDILLEMSFTFLLITRFRNKDGQMFP